MNELWIIGLIASGAGAAIGGPLLIKGRAATGSWPTERIAGLWLLCGACAMLLDGMRHGGLFGPDAANVVEHITDTGDIVAWTVLLMIARRIAGIERAWPSTVADHALMPLGYLLILASLGWKDIRFYWILPVGLVCSAVISMIWFRRRESLSGDARLRLTALFMFAVAFSAAQTVRSLFPHVLALREIVPTVIAMSLLAVVYVFSVRRPAEAAPQSYRKSALTSRRAGELLAALDAHMRADAWYREADLTLGEIASRLGVSPQTVSQALNQQRKQTLLQYLSARRVEEAKVLLADPANDCFTIEGVAQRSGFASRSAFYKIFKNAEGVTPTEFRARCRATLTAS